MFAYRNNLLLLLLTLLFFSCNGSEQETSTDSVKTEKPLFQFAVAGHVYGNSDNYTNSIYPPFLDRFDAVKKYCRYLFLTGDVVMESTDSNWSRVRAELDNLYPVDWYIAPGNHDLGPAYDTLRKKSALNPWLQMDFMRRDRSEFLVLNTSNAGWTMPEYEAHLLKDMLRSFDPDSTDHIFVFTHQLWWLRNTPPEFDLDSVRPNSYALYEGESDFWQDVFPYFDSTGIETWFFAGDLGADPKLESYYEDHHNQFHFYASGMGGGKADNYLIVSVYQNGHVDIEQVSF